MAAIAAIVEKFITAANAFLKLIGVDYTIAVDPAISEDISKWFDFIVAE